LSFLGRPRRRKHDSSPRRVAVSRVHDSLPYGRPRDTECRKRLRSPAESGSLTRSSQCLSRTCTSPLHKSGSRRCHLGKLDHFQLEMVGHQAITKKIYPNTRAGVGHRLHQNVVITGLAEHRLAPVAPTQYMLPINTCQQQRHARFLACYQCSTSTGHDVNKSLCPPFSTLFDGMDQVGELHRVLDTSLLVGCFPL
jgi:hypothetical protein